MFQNYKMQRYLPTSGDEERMNKLLSMLPKPDLILPSNGEGTGKKRAGQGRQLQEIRGGRYTGGGKKRARNLSKVSKNRKTNRPDPEAIHLAGTSKKRSKKIQREGTPTRLS